MLMKQLNEKLFKSTKLIKTLKQKANVLDMILKQFPHVSNETPSDYVTLNNTAKAPMEVSLTPQTSQETTTGKNLVTGLYNKQTGFISYSFDSTKLTENMTYSFTPNFNVSGINLYVRTINNTGVYNKVRFDAVANQKTILNVTLTTEEIEILKATNCILQLYKPGGYTTDDDIFEPQFESGSTATSYEPYTGIPSPNPDYPQDIHRTTGENQVKVVGKNLFSGDYSQFTSTGGTGNLYGYFKIPDDNETYTLSITAKKDFTPTMSQYIGFTKSGGQAGQGFVWLISGGTSYAKGQKKEVINYQGSTRLDYVSIYSNNANTLQKLVENFDIQLEKGSSATSYTPYEETTYPISLGTKEMFNINNVADGFVYDENEDKFYINRKIYKLILDTELPWKPIEDGYRYKRTRANLPKNSYVEGARGFVLSNYFLYNNSYQTDKIGSCFISQDKKQIYVYPKQQDSLPDFLSWLDDNKTLGNPVLIIYQLDESELEPIEKNSVLDTQLHTIKNALSMQGATHIISTASGSNLPFLIKASAIKSFE